MQKSVTRVILKLSGERFSDKDQHISFPQYDKVARQLVELQNQTKIELAIVVGGGNIFRGRQAATNVDHTEADAMGMMATMINGIGLREAFVRNGAPDTRLMTSLPVPAIAEPYIRPKARHHLDNGRIILLAGGLGLPNFSTDSAVAQFADELKCEMILKASTVDGVYDSDPRKNTSAKKFSVITYREALIKELGIMDSTAFAMCSRSKIPIFVFNIEDLDKLPKILKGDYSFGTLIKE